MSEVIAIAARSMADDIERLAVISHNLSNAATHGYKSEMTLARPFADLMQIGGVGVDTLALTSPASLPELRRVTNHRAGPMQSTGHAFDLALEGDGFFELHDPATGPVYTRQGRFALDASGRMVDAAGRVLLGSGGELRIEGGEPRIDSTGRVWDRDTLLGQVNVVRFDDKAGLTKLGAGVYAAGIGQSAEPVTDVRVRQGFLEASNVVAATEMVRLIETMRHFEFNQKLIQGYDEVQERAIRSLGEF